MDRFLLLFLLFLTPWAKADFAAGCAAYEAGKYPEALKEFQAVAQTQLSAELAYNLGCTESKLDHPGAASLWFHRAILLEPRHAESLQNLRFLKKKFGLVSFDTSPLDQAVKVFALETWQTLTWALLWVVLLCSGILWLHRPRILWPWITVLCLAFVLGGVAAAAWFTRHRQVPPIAISVVQIDGSNVVNAPANSADVVIAINAGSQVRPLETRNDWTYVELPGDPASRGWLRTETLEPLWPFNARPGPQW